MKKAKEENTITISGDGIAPVTMTDKEFQGLAERMRRQRTGGAFFTTDNVPFFLNGVRLWVAKDDNDQLRRMADCTFQVAPLEWSFADEISDRLADHIFARIGDKWEPRDELADFTFDLHVESQAMTYRSHPEIEQGGGFIENARIQKLRVNKDPKLGVLFLTFVASFPIVSKEVTSRLAIDLLKEKVYLSFKPMEERLFQ